VPAAAIFVRMIIGDFQRQMRMQLVRHDPQEQKFKKINPDKKDYNDLISFKIP